ncbi:MAG: DUF1566 domain-containing protein [Nitrospinaceae bacterium]|nr:DUF1566 domain-containing protein [Nitrospinaceae bacterium]NIR55510.1 DUF1566 domain-containing protein [Nitrospinaceae bacterium]NIS85943.1 DUF1566 domain-containing protein [Nitrospinaceae bacterium]NIT82790.1 DUF1566 domain-containing protein [Nitrospinaceae bacterium]NIU44994.1 DUF1566 domain-containing protein [Nitrospinaceae bacterium]
MSRRFQDNQNGTITDTCTGLMWQESYAYIETGRYIDWYEANDYIRDLNRRKLGGHSDWRLPTRLELQSLYEIGVPFESRGRTYFLHIDPIFEFSYGSCFWTGDTRLSAALGFEFDTGDMHWYPQGSVSASVRAVRGRMNPVQLIDPSWPPQARKETIRQAS